MRLQVLCHGIRQFKLVEIRLLAKYRRGWEDNIKIDLKYNAKNWIVFAQDYWRAHVNAASNLRVL